MFDNSDSLTKLERLLLFLWVYEKFKDSPKDAKAKRLSEIINFLELGKIK